MTLRSRPTLATGVAVLTTAIAVALAASPGAGAGAGASPLYPDLQTVVPRQLGVQNANQREYVRFSNGIANTGRGQLRVRPEPPVGTPTEFTTAIQELLDPSGNVVAEHNAGSFEWHEAHNHWHIGQVALFEVRTARDDGSGGRYGAPVQNDRGEAQSVKTTFCLIDWYKLDGNANTKERNFWDCERGYQGISPGWVDQYHQSLEGQKLDVTGAAPGVYYLVSVSNPAGVFLESDTSDNTAWVSFRLSRDSEGNPKLTELSHSRCSSPGLCGDNAPNR